MKQTRVQSAQVNSRLRDNHFDQNVHNRAWIAPGIVSKIPKYQHMDSGLVIIADKIEKFKNYKELSEINEEVQKLQESRDFRHFKEFENIYNGDLIITIEYCTNCAQHQGSTRHDEEKYYSIATGLKQEIIQHYPIAKVYLKPLIYDPRDLTVDSLYIQRRIGAFEIQVCSKNQDKLKKDVIFSKLQTKQWPIYQEVIQSLIAYLNTSNLEIYVAFNEGVVGDLKNIQITLSPHRNHGDVTQRPQSSLSKTSNQTRKTTTRTKIDRNIHGVTDAQGVLKLIGVPIDVYTVEINESNDIQGEQFLLNMVDMYENNQDMQFVVKVRKQPHSSLEIRLLTYQGSITVAQVIVQHSQSLETVQARETKGGIYEIVVDPGYYIIRAIAKGFMEQSQEFDVAQGVNRISFQLELDPNSNNVTKPPTSAKPLQPIPKQQTDRVSSARPQSSKPIQQPQQQPYNTQDELRQQEMGQISQSIKLADPQVDTQPVRPISGYKTTVIFIYDPYYNQPISGVTVNLHEESTKKVMTYQTDEEGICKVILQGILEGKLIIQQKGFFEIMEEYGPSQNKMNLNQLRELSFPLIQQPKDDKSLMLMVQTNVEAMPIDLKFILPDNIQIDSSYQNIDYDFNEESGCLKITVKDVPNKKGVYRIYADIIDYENLHPQSLKLYVVTNKELKLVDVPKFLNEDSMFWDIGIICAPQLQFLEINTPTTEPLKKDKFLKDYQLFLQFVKNSKTIDMKTLLGFNDRDKLEIQGDVFVQKEKIKSSLEKYGFENGNLEYLIQSAMMANGLYSFKRLEQKFKNLDFDFMFDQQAIGLDEDDEYQEDEPYPEEYDDI